MVVVVFSEKVVDACSSQFCLLMSVRGRIKKKKLHSVDWLAVLSGGTGYPCKKSHKRKDGKLRVLQLIKKIPF